MSRRPCRRLQARGAPAQGRGHSVHSVVGAWHGCADMRWKRALETPSAPHIPAQSAPIRPVPGSSAISSRQVMAQALPLVLVPQAPLSFRLSRAPSRTHNDKKRAICRAEPTRSPKTLPAPCARPPPPLTQALPSFSPPRPYLVLRDNLCSCEAYGMRPTQKRLF